jgi:hypothetical protein
VRATLCKCMQSHLDTAVEPRKAPTSAPSMSMGHDETKKTLTLNSLLMNLQMFLLSGSDGRIRNIQQ